MEKDPLVFQELIRAKSVPLKTLIWVDGLPSWLALRDALEPLGLTPPSPTKGATAPVEPSVTAPLPAAGSGGAGDVTVVVPDHVRAVFERIDQNGDGQLSRVELFTELKQNTDLQVLLRLPAKVFDSPAVFKGMDLDDDGTITLLEFATSVAAVELMAAQFSEDEPVSAQAEVPEAELAATNPIAVADNVRAAFDRIDGNGDGQLTKTELFEAVKKDAELQELLGLPHLDLASKSSKADFAQLSQLSELFNGMDLDNDGTVTLHEFAAFRTAGELLSDQFSAESLDALADNSPYWAECDLSEARELCSSEEEGPPQKLEQPFTPATPERFPHQREALARTRGTRRIPHDCILFFAFWSESCSSSTD